jgi:hypothetical protein
MSSNVVNASPFLRTTRSFPEELQPLTVEINKSYLDIANAVNDRTIGLFPVNRPAITGEGWFIASNQKQQTLRQVYTFTSTTSINHGITIYNPGQFTSCYGSYTDGTNSYGLIFGTSTAVAGLITFYLTSSQIVFETGSGAPSLSSGTIVLEWLSAP